MLSRRGWRKPFGIFYVLREFGIQSNVVGRCDSAAARGIANRSGVGRLKHLELKQIWIQQYVKERKVRIEWIPRSVNPADGLTHISSEFHGHMRRLQQVLQPRI